MSAQLRPLEGVASETTGARIARLIAEARLAAGEHVGELEEALAQVARLAQDVAEGGAAYSVGVRTLCRSLTADLEGRRRSLHGLRPAPALPAPVAA